MFLSRQFEDLADLFRPVDLARIARHPGCAHRLAGDALEVLLADLYFAEGCGTAHPRMKSSSTSAASLPGWPIAVAISVCCRHWPVCSSASPRGA